jgi:hypothetical protein
MSQAFFCCILINTLGAHIIPTLKYGFDRSGEAN